MEESNKPKKDGRGGYRPGSGRPRIEGRSHILHTPIPDTLWNKLEEYAKTNGVTKNAVIVRLLESL